MSPVGPLLPIPTQGFGSAARGSADVASERPNANLEAPLVQMSSYRFRTDLEPAVVRAEAEILRIVQAIVPKVELKRIGPLGTDDKSSWSCWIVTATDIERDVIKNDSALIAKLWKASSDAGFAPDSFTVQSHETVKRDYRDNWFYAMR